MKKFWIIIVVVVLVIIAAAFLVREALILREAHSTFDNYYAFRGCVRLLERTYTDGICKTSSGDTIRIVEYKGGWYLDGDLPWFCFGSACFGI